MDQQESDGFRHKKPVAIVYHRGTAQYYRAVLLESVTKQQAQEEGAILVEHQKSERPNGINYIVEFRALDQVAYLAEDPKNTSRPVSVLDIKNAALFSKDGALSLARMIATHGLGALGNNMINDPKAKVLEVECKDVDGEMELTVLRIFYPLRSSNTD